MKSLLLPHVPKTTVDIASQDWGPDTKLYALEYLCLEDDLKNITKLTLDKDALEFITKEDFKEELAQELEKADSVTIDLSSDNIPVANKAIAAIAYVHQQIKKTIYSYDTFEIFFNNLPSISYRGGFWSDMTWGIDPTVEKILGFDEKEAYRQIFKIALSESFLSKELTEKVNEYIEEQLKSGTDPEILYDDLRKNERICGMDFNEINQGTRTMRIYQKLLAGSEKIDYGIFKIPAENYRELDSREKRRINERLIENLHMADTVGSARDFPEWYYGSNFIGERRLDHAYDEAKEFFVKLQSFVDQTALMLIDTAHGLLPAIKYRIELLEKSRGVIYRDIVGRGTSWSDYNEINEDSFFKVFPFRRDETPEFIYELYRKIFPGGVRIGCDHYWQYEDKIYLHPNGTMTTSSEDRYVGTSIYEDKLNATPENRELRKAKMRLSLFGDRLGEDSMDMMVKYEEHEGKLLRKRFGGEPPRISMWEKNILPSGGDGYVIEGVGNLASELRYYLDRNYMIEDLIDKFLDGNSVLPIEDTWLYDQGHFRDYTESDDPHQKTVFLSDISQFLSRSLPFLERSKDMYYNILGLALGADGQQIKDSYRKLARKYHPDMTMTSDDTKFKDVTEAYDALSNPRYMKTGLGVSPYIGKIMGLLERHSGVLLGEFAIPEACFRDEAG